MSYRIITSRQLVDALQAEGFSLPEGCTEARIVIQPKGPFVMQYDTYLSIENLRKLGKAFQRLADDWQKIQLPKEPA